VPAEPAGGDTVDDSGEVTEELTATAPVPAEPAGGDTVDDSGEVTEEPKDADTAIE